MSLHTRFWQHSADNDGYNDAFPGLSIRKVDMEPYNAHRSPSNRRQLQYYRAIGPMPPFSDDPNLHACAHLYASDRNGLFIISTLLNMSDQFRQMTSLSHSVILHFTGNELSMLDDEGAARWFCQEARVCRTADGRGTVDSRLWSDRYNHIGTTYQDALARARGSISPSEVNSAKKSIKGKL
jgi:acyl-CoA thioesterase